MDSLCDRLPVRARPDGVEKHGWRGPLLYFGTTRLVGDVGRQAAATELIADALATPLS
jgi:hypothetical protein